MPLLPACLTVRSMRLEETQLSFSYNKNNGDNDPSTCSNVLTFQGNCFRASIVRFFFFLLFPIMKNKVIWRNSKVKSPNLKINILFSLQKCRNECLHLLTWCPRILNVYIYLLDYYQNITVPICYEDSLPRWLMLQSFGFPYWRSGHEHFCKEDISHSNIHLEFRKFILIIKPKEAQTLLRGISST